MARGIYNRLVEDDRFLSKTILSEVQWCLNAMLSSSGFSAYQMLFGSNPVDFFGWEDGDEDLLYARDTSLAGQFVQQWKLRTRAQKASLKEMASSNLRRLLARKKAFNCAEADIGDMELFYKAQNRKGLPRWRGPAKVIGMDESGVTVTFQSQTFKVARYCVPRRPKDSDLQGGERPALAMLHDCGTARWETICG